MNAVALPVLLPLATAVAQLALRRHASAQRALALAGGVVLVAAAAFLVARTAGGEVRVLALGGWGAQVGIVWVVDRLGATMLALASLVSLAALAQSNAALRGAEERGHYHPLHQLVLAGVNGSFVTGDLFNLFVFFEVMLVASFALIVLGGRARQLNRTFPYVLLNLVASALFLVGVGAVYGSTGTVNLAELSTRLAEGASPGARAGLALVLVTFGVKAGVAPLFFWLPDSYPESPLPAGAFFAGLLTKVGVYALFRTVPLLWPAPGAVHQALLAVAVVTMAAGVVGALGRDGVRAILSFHSVSQVGYMVLGLALLTPLGLAGGLYFVVHHGLVKSALFLSGGALERLGAGGPGGARGLARTHPWLAAAFLLPALALAGLPPLSGFWAKVFVVGGAFEAGAWISAAVAIVVSLLTLASMLKIWVAVFWGEPGRQPPRPAGRALVGAPLALAALSVVLGLAVAPVHRWSRDAADQLLERRPYVDAVLGVTGRARAHGRQALPAPGSGAGGRAASSSGAPGHAP